MKTKDDFQISEIVHEEIVNEFIEERQMLRQKAKEQIA